MSDEPPPLPILQAIYEIESAVALAGLGKGSSNKGRVAASQKADPITIGLEQPVSSSTTYGVVLASAALVIGAAGIFLYRMVNR